MTKFEQARCFRKTRVFISHKKAPYNMALSWLGASVGGLKPAQGKTLIKGMGLFADRLIYTGLYVILH